MTKKKLLQYIDYLRNKADFNKLVVFVGAGVSRNVHGMPSWNELVCNMAKTIGYTKCSSCYHKNSCPKTCPASADFSSDDYLKIPQYVFNDNPALYRTTLLSNISGATNIDAPLSKAIFELNPDHIITTNYDRLLESSTSISRSNYDVIVTDKDLLDSQKSKYIIKMHGDIADLKSIVLKEQDYLDYSRTHVLIELFIRSLIVDHIVLFVGYSLNDINVKQIISWINYIRTQNSSLTRNRYVGYIVLDEPSIDKNTLTYFAKNNICVINIFDYPLVSNLPPDLDNPKGQRLYSFLNSIYDPMQRFAVFPIQQMENTVDFLVANQVYDYRFILSKLNIKPYELFDSTLILYKNSDFTQIYNFVHSRSNRVDTLLQLFVNSGIKEIKAKNSNNSNTITIEKENTLFIDALYSEYIQNNYIKLLELCEAEKDINKKVFYLHFIYGYNKFTEADIKTDSEPDSINKDLTSLFNLNVLKAQTTFFFSTSDIKKYINSIGSSEKREAYQYFSNICEGNNNLIRVAKQYLDVLKEHVKNNTTIYFATGGTISDFYKIKDLVLTQYLFFYNNCLLCLSLKDVRTLYHIYAESIICSNSDFLSRKYTSLGIETTNNKYNLTALDIDIISKYTSTKELSSFFSTYNASSLCIPTEVLNHLITIFDNLANAFIAIEAYGNNSTNIEVFCNLAILLCKTELSDSNKESITKTMEVLLSNMNFDKYLWSYLAHNNDCLYAVSNLCKSLSPTNNPLCVHALVFSFLELNYHPGIRFSRDIIEFFMPENQVDSYEKSLTDIVDSQKDINKKILLLRLLYRRIMSTKAKQKYTSLLSRHFDKLDTQAIYDFVFSKWYKPSKRFVSALLTSFLQLKKNQKKFVKTFPDPIESKLECIYILFLEGYIKDLHPLEKYESDYPHLQFLLHPESFDYNLVDFSDYMWMNFALHHKYMYFFKLNKEYIIPKLTERVKKQNATENEKKILYGFFLANSNEIWQI